MPEKTIINKIIDAIIVNDSKKLARYLSLNINPNSYEDEAMISPLHYAVLYNSFECAQVLIAAGSNPLHEDAEGESPMELARITRNKIFLDFLKQVSQQNKIN